MRMAEVVSGFQRFGIQFGAIFWFALLLFGLLGLGVVYVLSWWMLALIVAAGIAIGLATYFPRWLLRRTKPGFSPRKSLFVHALGGVLATMGLAALPIYFMAFWVTSGPNAVPLATGEPAC
jgi:hypothetical protein